MSARPRQALFVLVGAAAIVAAAVVLTRRVPRPAPGGPGRAGHARSRRLGPHEGRAARDRRRARRVPEVRDCFCGPPKTATRRSRTSTATSKTSTAVITPSSSAAIWTATDGWTSRRRSWRRVRAASGSTWPFSSGRGRALSRLRSGSSARSLSRRRPFDRALAPHRDARPRARPDAPLALGPRREAFRRCRRRVRHTPPTKTRPRRPPIRSRGRASDARRASPSEPLSGTAELPGAGGCRPLVPGARVAAPFGSALATGLVVSLDPPPAPEGTLERDVVAALDDAPFLPQRLVSVLVRAAAYYLVPPGELLRSAVPARLLAASEAVFVPTSRAVGAPAGGVEGKILGMLLEMGEARLPELAAGAGRRVSPRPSSSSSPTDSSRIRSENLRAAAAPSDRAWVARPAPDGHPALRARRNGAPFTRTSSRSLGPRRPRSFAPPGARPPFSRPSRRRDSFRPSRSSGAPTSCGTSARSPATRGRFPRRRSARPSTRFPQASARESRGSSFSTA